jgi:hypothetical protein
VRAHLSIDLRQARKMYNSDIKNAYLHFRMWFCMADLLALRVFDASCSLAGGLLSQACTNDYESWTRG